jgi:phosphomannomutase
MPSSDADVIARAMAWRDQDPDPETRAELTAMIAASSNELSERFAGPLEFGTAGLRGLLGAGETRMNRAVVRRTTAGLCRYLLDHVPNATTRGVVIGYDGRRQSDVFAREAAQVLTASGIVAHLADGVVPTPLCAFAVTELGAAAGIMVTASHNPPAYNGYKVYAANGAQIIPPADTLIADAIANAGAASVIPLAPLEEAQRSGLLKTFGAEVKDKYLAAIGALCPAGGDRSLAVVYTPLHGVGAELFERAFAAAGFSNLRVVPEQAKPDGAFPTVAYPNPEEPGALDLALALATSLDAPLVLANDPDADRLAAAVRVAPGRYQQLTGNELGVLLGHALLAGGSEPDRLVVTTIVSSPQLGVIARALGVAYAETLTGFKWIANKAMEQEAQAGKRFVFGYEEALGYTVDTVVRDKDGIGTALVLAALVADLHQRGETLFDELARVGRRFGFYASSQRSLAFPGARGAEAMAARMDALRSAAPAAIGGHAVIAVRDCERGVRVSGGREEPLDLPRSDVLVFELDGGHRVIARPSGTEPKMKIYFDVREPMAADEPLEAVRKRALAHCADLANDMLQLFA